MEYNIKYTSEYFLKLQIHKHYLLTRKVFSWHSSSAQVFITRSSSKLDHHWIITGSLSNMDHHWIIIITAPAISSKWCYLSIILIIGIYTDPSLFHAGCRSQHLYSTMGGLACHHVEKAQCLHLTMGGPTCHHVRNSQHLHPAAW